MSVLKSKSLLSKVDELILDSYKTTLEGLGVYLGDAFEFVLHDLKNLDHSVIQIINGYHSGRKEGAPITDLALDMLEQINKKNVERYIAYYAKSKHGKPLKSITIAIFGEHDKAIGLICINMYLDTPINTLLETFSKNNNTEYISEHYINNSDELIRKVLKEIKKEVMEDKNIPVSRKNKEIITYLYHQGIFKLKDAIIIVSDSLGLSRNTVYLHIRSLDKAG
jgi:predicted transcriptional regulator YheO